MSGSAAPSFDDPALAKFWLPFQIGSGRSAFAGADIAMEFKWNARDSRLIGRIRFGAAASGPPGHAHGGALAYALDEAMGACAWLNACPAVAAKLAFEYARMTPIKQSLIIEAWIESRSEKRAFARSHLWLSDGHVAVRGSGEFALVKKSDGLKLLASPAGQPPDDELGRAFRARSLQWAADEEG